MGLRPALLPLWAADGTARQALRPLRTIALLVLLGAAGSVWAQQEEDFKYMRGSLCMMMVENPLSEYKPEIRSIYESMDIPSRFNDHRFGKVSVLKFPNRTDMVENLQTFALENQLAKRIVGKWFGHNRQTDGFNTDLLASRGLYNASEIDIATALKTMRGKAMLEDMGENLIGHTYWVVTDFEYKNHKNFMEKFAETFRVLEGGLKVYTGGLDSLSTMLRSDTLSIAGSLDKLFDEYEGYRMKATSYLFRLRWNDEVANQFYLN